MRITKLALGTLTALCLSLTGGCDDSKKDAKDAKVEAKADAKADAKAADAKAADAKLEVVADAPAPDTIGVAECDDYISKMNACIAGGKVPADQLEGQKMGLEMYAKSWADAKKANPGDGAALVPGCKAAIEMGKVSHPTCFEG
jgi:hypothetical protein